MSILGFFDDVERRKLEGGTLNREYSDLLRQYERSGHVMPDGSGYRLTKKGVEYLSELRRKLLEILAGGFVEGVPEEIDS